MNECECSPCYQPFFCTHSTVGKMSKQSESGHIEEGQLACGTCERLDTYQHSYIPQISVRFAHCNPFSSIVTFLLVNCLKTICHPRRCSYKRWRCCLLFKMASKTVIRNIFITVDISPIRPQSCVGEKDRTSYYLNKIEFISLFSSELNQFWVLLNATQKIKRLPSTEISVPFSKCSSGVKICQGSDEHLSLNLYDPVLWKAIVIACYTHVFLTHATSLISFFLLKPVQTLIIYRKDGCYNCCLARHFHRRIKKFHHFFFTANLEQQWTRKEAKRLMEDLSI